MNAPNATKIILLRLQSIVIGRKNSLNDRRVKNMCNVRVACKICFRSAGRLMGGGVNRGMQIRRSVPFFRQIRRSAKFLFKSETTTTSAKRKGSRFKGKQLHVNGMVNFAQIVKKATCLMTITQYNSNNSLIPEFK